MRVARLCAEAVLLRAPGGRKGCTPCGGKLLLGRARLSAERIADQRCGSGSPVGVGGEFIGFGPRERVRLRVRACSLGSDGLRVARERSRPRRTAAPTRCSRGRLRGRAVPCCADSWKHSLPKKRQRQNGFVYCTVRSSYRKFGGIFQHSEVLNEMRHFGDKC